MGGTVRSLIVDKTASSDRAKWVAGSLSSVCEETWYIDAIASDRNGVYKHPDQNMRDGSALPDYFDVVLLHRTHREALPNDINYSRLVNYTSADGRCSGGGEYWINRGIKTEKDSLTNDEAKKLIEWALSPDDQELPPLLQCLSRPTLVSLIILSQGYLAAQGGETLNGWKQVSKQLKEAAIAKEDEVIRAEWWKEGLGNLKEAEVVKRLRREMDINEMPNNDSITHLIQMIYGMELVDDTMLVVNAYTEAKEVLQKV